MTSPANGFPNRAQPTGQLRDARPATAAPKANGGSAFGAATPPDHRTTSLQNAVAMLRGRPLAKTEDVLSMANAFLQFLKASDR